MSDTCVYPAGYESDIVLRDGSTLRLRPLRTEDAGALVDLHRRLSSESRFFRFLSATPNIEDRYLQSLCNVDYENVFALVGEAAGRLVAVAHYFRNAAQPRRAEVAFAIEDGLQGRGIGTRLLEQLAEVARDHNIDVFDAEVHGDNRKMMSMFLHCGFEVRRRLEGGEYLISFPIALTRAYAELHARRSQHAATASMKVFFEPRSVAVVGASRSAGIGRTLLKNLLNSEFGGVVYPVNPSAHSVCGARAYARVTDIPDEVDLAVIVVAAERVLAVVDDCIAKGVRGLVVISAGFAECGPEGRRREEALMEKVRAAGIRLIGPNCMGVLNTDPPCNATFSPVSPPSGGVAMSTQSGALGIAILQYANQLNLGISTFASLGNKCDVSGNDLIQYWAEDARTRVILLYLESFGNPRRFGRIAPAVARQKPIVAVKSGRSGAGSRAASSHTAALAAPDTAVEALFRQAGIIRTDTLEEMFDVAALLAHQPVPAGRRVAILSNAGGPAILAADACEARGLELPPLEDATVAELRSFLPATASVANPVDTIASVTAENYARAMRALLRDGNVDSLIAIYIPLNLTDIQPFANAIVAGAEPSASKPVLATFMSAQPSLPSLGTIPRYSFPESAAVALSRVADYGRWLRRPTGTVPVLANLDATAARAVIEGALRRGGGWLDPAATVALLHALGIEAAAATMVGPEPEEALTAAAALGYPVALKAVGPGILHKTEVGAVKLDLKNAASLRLAHAELHGQLSGHGLSGMLVQQMVSGGVEVAVGATVDPMFGPLVMYGSGGTMVELLHDVTFALHPLTNQDARDMLERVKGTARLRGYRGAPLADEGAVQGVLLRLSAALELCPEIVEVDINPLMVGEHAATAVDARIRVQRPTPPAPSRRIVY